MKKILLASFFLMNITAALAQSTFYQIIDFATGQPIVGLDVKFRITSDPVLSGYEGPLPTQSGGWVSFFASTSSSSGRIFFDAPCITIVSGDPNSITNGQNHVIVIKGGKAQLMARDAVTDLGIEPNPSGDVWQSPDLWNRRDATGPDVNQEPGYQSGNNLMKMKVTNIGCVPSTPSWVKMYWTLGSTGEHWPGSWNGTTLINGKKAGNEITGGAGYTQNKGYQVAALQPGQSIIIEGTWMPPNPVIYAPQPGDPSPVADDAMICFLGRIDDPAQDPMYSELSSSTVSTGHNIGYNNNIVTRNSKLVNLPGAYKGVRVGGSIFVKNYYEEATKFNVTFKALTDADIRFGDVGIVTLKLDERLWNAWMEGGRVAQGVEISNEEQHEVRLTDLSNAVLQNINMEPGIFMSAAPSFELSKETDITGTYQFGISQERVNYKTDEEKYGTECDFIVTVNGEENSDAGTSLGKQLAPKTEAAAETKTATLNNLAVYPNPSDDKATIQFNSTVKENAVNIRITDLAGKLIRQSLENTYNSKGQNTIIIDTKNIKSGLYIVSIQSGNNIQSAKLNILH